MPRAVALSFLSAIILQAAALEPSPKLTPREVVEAQLAAFRVNDEPSKDAGIHTAFRFASPENKRSTGPIERFVEMVKNPLYAPLLNHRAAHMSDTTQKDDLARIKVTVVGADGAEAAFVWILSRVTIEGCDGCWLTATVMRVDSKESPFKIAGAFEKRLATALLRLRRTASEGTNPYGV